jgi:phosphomannomutase
MTNDVKDGKDPRPERLQGTDGVRRPVRPASDFAEGPLEVFLKHGVMTEEFFELYCYAHARDLIETGKIAEGDDVLIGWDPRDVEKFYVSRAISGVAKAGARPVVLGVFPTPGVALSLVCLEAASAFVITASHNPKDNNGIKIFMGPDAMKHLPEDDKRLTERIYAVDFGRLRGAEEKFHPFDASEHERNRFIHFHLDERNTWVNLQEKPFSRSAVVVDTAHGALSGIAPLVFSELGFHSVAEVAAEQNGDVNKDSGVAYLEGLAEITGRQFDEGGALSRHKLIKKMFETGRASEKTPLLGVSFDADGDRFMVLLFDKGNDSVRVLSGDESLALQSAHLMRTNPGAWKGRTIAFTVESDVNLSRYAESLGFKPVITAVGDKWILQKANQLKDTFGIGGEETGHSISLGTTTLACRDEKRIFTGNGLKGAINTLLAMHKLAGEKDLLDITREPFETGFRHSSYAYYVDKSLFHRGGEVWREVEKMIRDSYYVSAEGELQLVQTEIDGEPDMLYIKIAEGDGSQAGSLFVRNSGTENKISVNARGPVRLESSLKPVCDKAIGLLMRRMTDEGNPMATAQAKILKMLAEGIQPKRGAFPGLDFDRLLHEMELKQKLIVMRDGNYFLTKLGEGLLE